MDWFKSILKVIDHERGKVVGVLIAVTLCVIMFGCNTTITSPVSGDKVDVVQFNLELDKERIALEKDYEAIIVAQSSYNARVERFNASADNGTQAFEKAEEFKQNLAKFGSGVISTVVSGGTLNVQDVLTSSLLLLGLGGAGGGMYDALRKNRVINKLKAEKTTTA